MIPQLHRGLFQKRYKRFFANVIDQYQQCLTLHCPNTGAMTGLLQEGADALFSLAISEEMKKRKTLGTLEALKVQVQDRAYWVGVNTHRANQIARCWFELPKTQALLKYVSIQQEVKLVRLLAVTDNTIKTTGIKTRIDFVLNRAAQKPLLVEVKSATLFELGAVGESQGYFPDAVSIRATAQLKDMLYMRTLGYDVMVLYVSQHQGITCVKPAAHIDPEYAATVQLAKEAGVVFQTLPFNAGFYGIDVDE